MERRSLGRLASLNFGPNPYGASNLLAIKLTRAYVSVITDRWLYAYRRRWLRETERSRLNGVERAMPSSNNRLLASLSTNDFDLLGPHLECVTLGLRKNLERPNRRIDAVYFPEADRLRCCRSIQGKAGRGRIDRPRGHDGFADRPGNHRSPHATYIQAPGDGQVHSSGRVAQGDPNQRIARNSLLKFVQAFGVQTTHTAISNARSRLDVRLARWLLMAHDRIGEDTLSLTHEFLSLMLGVRRPGVTEALHALRKQELIAYGRGQITVKDRKGLERAAGETYGTPEAEYRRLIG